MILGECTIFVIWFFIPLSIYSSIHSQDVKVMAVRFVCLDHKKIGCCLLVCCFDDFLQKLYWRWQGICDLVLFSRSFIEDKADLSHNDEILDFVPKSS